MFKRIAITTLIIAVVWAISFFTHQALLTETIGFSLKSVYLFHAIAAAIIYILVEVIADSLPTQAGYAYLLGMMVKFGIFMMMFSESVFEKAELLQAEKVALVLPLLLFLLVEATAVGKLLNSK